MSTHIRFNRGNSDKGIQYHLCPCQYVKQVQMHMKFPHEVHSSCLCTVKNLQRNFHQFATGVKWSSVCRMGIKIFRLVKTYCSRHACYILSYAYLFNCIYEKSVLRSKLPCSVLTLSSFILMLLTSPNAFNSMLRATLL